MVSLQILASSYSREEQKAEGTTYHGTSGEALCFVVVLHDKVDKREEYRGNARVQTQKKPGCEFQAIRDIPDSKADIGEDQNATGEYDWHPYRVYPARE